MHDIAKSVFLSAIFLAIFFMIPPPEILAGGKWVEINKTSPFNDGLCPGTGNTPPFPKQQNDCRSVTGAWGGGILRTKTEDYCLWGGGHGDYPGNEIYCLDLDTKVWRLETQPSQAFPGYPCGTLEEYSDNTPSSRHTYGLLAYIEHTDELFAYSGSTVCGGGFRKDTWVYSFETKKWTKLAPKRAPGNKNLIIEYNDVDDHVYGMLPNGAQWEVWRFDRTKATWSRVSSGNAGPTGGRPSWLYSGAITPDPHDSSKRWFVVVGPQGVQYTKLDGSDQYEVHTMDTTGATYGTGNTSICPRACGVAWNPVKQRLMLWAGALKRTSKKQIIEKETDNFPDRVYSLNLSTGAWTYQTVTGHPAAGGNGTYDRLRYSRKFGTLVIQNTMSQNLFLYYPDWVEIGNGQWTHRPYLTKDPHAPFGGGGTKHVRLSVNADNGLIYALGGDHGGSGYTTGAASQDSGRNEIHTYDMVNHVSALIQKYCRADNTLQPQRPDEVGFPYDTKRKVFWHMPGFNHPWGGRGQKQADTCPGSNFARHKIMQFDPQTLSWNNTGIKADMHKAPTFTQYGNVGFFVYDELSGCDLWATCGSNE